MENFRTVRILSILSPLINFIHSRIQCETIKNLQLIELVTTTFIWKKFQSPKSEPLPPHTSGRGIIMSTLRALSQPAMNETPPSEISSTTDALAQLRLKQHEESSCLSEIDEQSFHELEAEAASFVNVSEEAVAEKRGTAGMTFICLFVFKFFSNCIFY